RADVHARVAMVVDLQLDAVPEVLVMPLGTEQHRGLSSPDDRAVHNFPLTRPRTPQFERRPATEGLAVEQRDPARFIASRDEITSVPGALFLPDRFRRGYEQCESESSEAPKQSVHALFLVSVSGNWRARLGASTLRDPEVLSWQAEILSHESP